MSDLMIPTWTLGDRMQKAREAAGISTAIDMAGRMGVSERTIRNWEQGSTEPKRPAVIAYASITGVPLWWLAGEEPPEDEPDAVVRSRWFSEPEPALIAS